MIPAPVLRGRLKKSRTNLRNPENDLSSRGLAVGDYNAVGGKNFLASLHQGLYKRTSECRASGWVLKHRTNLHEYPSSDLDLHCYEWNSRNRGAAVRSGACELLALAGVKVLDFFRS